MNISHDDMISAIERNREVIQVPRLMDGTPATHDVIADDVAAYLASGGVIEHPVCTQLRCEAPMGRTSTTDRRWVHAHIPITEHGDGLHHWRTKGRLTLPNSGEGKRPRAA